MKDRDCKYITADCYCHMNTCLINKFKNYELEDRAETLGLKEPYVMCGCFNDGCDKKDDCGFCEKTEADGGIHWKIREDEAKQIAKECADKIGDGEFREMYFEQQKANLKSLLAKLSNEIKQCEEAIDNLGH